MMEEYKTLRDLKRLALEILMDSGLSRDEAEAEVFRACQRAKDFTGKVACLTELIEKAYKGEI